MGIPRVPRAFARFLHASGALSLAVVLAASITLFAQHTRDDSGTIDAPSSAKSTDAPPTAPEARRRTARLREGTEIRDVPGRIHLADNRFEFVSHDGRYRMRILENLALERAARKSGESAQSVAWKVSGVVTEFESGNYLLVRRIVVDDAAGE